MEDLLKFSKSSKAYHLFTFQGLLIYLVGLPRPTIIPSYASSVEFFDGKRTLKFFSFAFPFVEVLEDFDFALERKHDTGVSLIRDAIKLVKPTLEFSG